ncbi:hypothetical protein UT300018_05400 [Clostridium faecium]|nr:hypothetical protein [Clostridium faecium]
MSEEILRITKMIGENKITAEEGARLIESLNDKNDIVIENKTNKRLEKV